MCWRHWGDFVVVRVATFLLVAYERRVSSWQWVRVEGVRIAAGAGAAVVCRQVDVD